MNQHPKKQILTKYFLLLLSVIVAILGYCPQAYAAENGYSYLRMPTQIIKINNTYFIVDCGHNQIIYSDNLGTELQHWNVMTRNAQQPHALASDGDIYMVVDTDNNRVLTFEKKYDGFSPLQTFEHVGTRPHFVDYDYEEGIFYVWSSLTGEMYLYKKIPDTKSVTLQEIKSIPELSGCYARSFTITESVILFPTVERSSILMVDKDTFEILNEYPVPECIAGMVQVSLIDGSFFITVSTDKQYDLRAAAVIRVRSLEDLATGNYENLYHLFGNDGTPYYVSRFDGAYYMIHENAAPNVYRFHVEHGTILDIEGMF